MHNTQSKKAGKVLLLFLLMVVGFIIFLGTILYHNITERKLPNLQSKRIENAIRGNIYSSDGFLLASSKKVYKAVVNTYNINPQKKELFINLFSIYSKIPKDEIAKKLEQKGNVILSYNIDSKRAASILDTFSCVFQGIIRYGAQMLLAIAATAECGYKISAFDIIRNLYYPFL